MTYFLERKSDATEALKTYLNDLRQMGYAPPLEIRSDQGSEFYNDTSGSQKSDKRSKFTTLCRKHRIIHRVTPAHKSHLNGIVERNHRTLYDAASAYLHEARLSAILWPYAIAYAEFVSNRIIHQALGHSITPYEIVRNRRARADRCRTFGCDVYVYDHTETKKAVPGRAKAKRMIYIGVPADTDSGFLVMDPETRRPAVAYDVVFDEAMANRGDELARFDAVRLAARTDDPLHGQPLAEERAALDHAGSTLQDLRTDGVRRLFHSEDRKFSPKRHAHAREPNSTRALGPKNPHQDLKSNESIKNMLTDSDDEEENRDHQLAKNVRPKPTSTRPIPAPSWLTQLPSVEKNKSDKRIGQYLLAPFDESYYFGIVLQRSAGDPREYEVQFEDGDLYELRGDAIDRMVCTPQRARPLTRPSRDEVAEAWGDDDDDGSVSDDRSERHTDAPDDAGAQPTSPTTTKTKTRKTVGVRRSSRRTSKPPTYAFGGFMSNDAPAKRRIGPLTYGAVESYHRRELLESRDGLIRPLRLEAVGRKAELQPSDRTFLKNAQDANIPVVYLSENPKLASSESAKRYSIYSSGTTLTESINLSIATRPSTQTMKDARARAIADIQWDYAHGYLYFPGNESLLEGHIFDALALASDYKI